MASIRRKLEKKGVIAMTLLTLVLIGTACEDRIDNPAVNPSEGKMVEVALNIGFANEMDGTTRSADTKAPNNIEGNKQAAFDMQLSPASQTRATTEATTAHPDKLYNLDIHQYRSNGTHLASFTVGNSIDPGTAITSKLNDNNGTECSLLIIARGATGAVDPLSNKSLSEINAITADKTKLETVDAITGANINNMPYLLYLPKVKIIDGKLVSPEGTDVRLLLKRLAVGVAIDWTFGPNMTSNNYTLTEVRLMQIPKDYRILPKPEDDPTFGTMYPNSVSEFVDGFRLNGENLEKTSSQTFWMPANARGTRNDVNYPTYRNKNYAHSAATYVEFVVDNTDANERLLYRAYLGGNTTNDFNLLENTNYHWTININNANYTTDPRIQLLDLSPVISTNLQTTSNCFMMLPGTNICFNPYKHEAGTNGWNTHLAPDGEIAQDKLITEVKVLWQSKDAGTSGDLVMGYVASDDNHKNLVNYENLNDVSKALVHVKVPVTNGGNAVIAAYHNNTIVWSWHLWISNYVPVGISQPITSEDTRKKAVAAAQKACAEGSVHQYRGAAWTYNTGSYYNKVIMDRNLGALRGTWSTTSSLESARAYGNLYQGGRKDPIPGSADGNRDDIDLMFDGNGVSMPLVVEKEKSNLTLKYSIEHPAVFLANSSASNRITDASWSTTKNINDPCPTGWHVPDFSSNNTNIWSDFANTNGGLTGSDKMLVNGNWVQVGSIGSIAETHFNIMNGIRYQLPNDSPNDYAWFPFFRLREFGTGLLRDPRRNDGTGNEQAFNSGILPSFIVYGTGASSISYLELKYKANYPQGLFNTFGLGIRCIQK